MTIKNTDLPVGALTYMWGEDGSGIGKKQAPIGTPISVGNGGTAATAAKDAAKNLSGIYVLKQSGVQNSISTGTAEVALATIVIPANLLGANGRLRATVLFTYTNSANNKTLRARCTDGTVSAVLHQLVATTTAEYRFQVEMTNRNATNSQVAAASGMTGGWNTTSGAIVTSSMDTTQDLTFTITGQPASSGETIALETYLVEVIQSAGN